MTHVCCKINRLFHLIIVLHVLWPSKGVLPDYTPALRKHKDVEGENAIRSYFLLGFTNAEIVGFLAVQQGKGLSVRTLKIFL